MTASPAFRKLTLTAHLAISIGWLGAVAAFVALAVAAVRSADEQTARAAFLAMAVLVSWVIVPLAFGSLASGLVSSLATPWGLFRHWWVVAKLVLTVVSIVVLLRQAGPIADLATLAADPASSVTGLPNAPRPLIHAVGGLVVLLAIQALGVYKPLGMTPCGRSRAEPREADGRAGTAV